jgi:hypothetical protein
MGILAISNIISNIYGETGWHQKVKALVWTEALQMFEIFNLTANR